MRRFGEHRFDLVTGELWRQGTPVKLQPVLARLLAALVSRPNELIERAELARHIWPAGTFVEYDNSLNNAVARLRRVIGAHWIEVIPKRGYRFRERRKKISRRRVDPVVERACRIGQHLWNRTTSASLEHALDHFSAAVRRDPDHAPGWAGMAEAYLLLGDDVLSGMPAVDALEGAKAAAGRALACSPECAEALAVSGMVAWRRDWDWGEAERFLRAALSLDKTAARPRVYYAWLLRAAGRNKQADAEVARALELDPVSSFVSANAGLMLYFSRRYSDAIAHLGETLTLDQHYPLAYLAMGLALVALGRSDEAVACLRRAVALAGERPDYYRAVLGYTLAASDRVAAARNLPANSRAFDRALVHLGLQENGASIDCLELALGEQSSHVAYLGADPLFDCLRGEARFRRLAKSIGIL